MGRIARGALAVVVATLVGCTAVLGTFDVGAAAGTDPGGTDAATTETSTSGGDDAGAGDAGALVCAAGLANCDNNRANGCETDTRTSADHCGRCDRKCGGAATCSGGECSVEKLKDGLDHPFALEIGGARLVWFESGGAAVRGCRGDDCAASTAILVDVNGATIFPNVDQSPRQFVIDGTNFLFVQTPSGSSFDSYVASCALTGCKLTGATAVSPQGTGNRRPLMFVAGPGAAYQYHPLDGLIRTALPGGTQTNVANPEQLQALHVDPMRIVFVDDNASQANPTGGVFLCAATGCTGSPTRLLPPPVKHLAFASGTIFTTTGGPSASTGSITACAVTGCANAGDVIATNQAFIRDIVADGDELYFVTTGVADVKVNAAALGTVMKCTLPGCPGGPKKVADNLVNPVAIRLTPTHAYWITYGAPSTMTGSVFRVRR